MPHDDMDHRQIELKEDSSLSIYKISSVVYSHLGKYLVSVSIDSPAESCKTISKSVNRKNIDQFSYRYCKFSTYVW